jgi:glycosyltransferase involved in cell wall biosynthesis
MNTMKIDAYNYSRIFGGQEKYLEDLSKELTRRGHLITIHGGPTQITTADSQCKESSRAAIAVELLNGYRALYLHALRPRKASIRLFVLHQDIRFQTKHPFKRWVRTALVPHLMRRVDAVIRVCDYALPDHYAPRHTKTIYNGVAVPSSVKRAIHGKSLELLMVGAVNDIKNQILALQLLEKLPGVRLTIVGDGPRRIEWQHWARKHGIEERVTWTGFLKDPSPHYLRADALLLLSKFEAFPMVMLEAMAHSLPVITVPVGGVHEAITNQVDGILLPDHDLVSLTAVVEQLRKNPERCRELGRQARRTVLQKFTLNQMVETFIEYVYSRVGKKGDTL